MQYNQCKNRIGERCKLTSEICQHLIYDGRCDNAEVDKIERVTFGEAYEAILTSDCSEQRLSYLKSLFRRFLEVSGFSTDDYVEDLTYDKAEEFVKYSNLNNDISVSVAVSMLNAIYYSGNKKFRTFYKKNMGKNLPLFEKYCVKIKRNNNKPQINWEQKTSIDFKMEELRRNATNNNMCERKRNQNRQLFIAMWFGRHFGVRPGDINRMKWGNIVYINGIAHLRFIPNKTLKSSGETVCWPLSERAFNEIRGFIGKSDEFCLSVETKFIPHKNNRKRNGIHKYLWKSLNDFFRGLGFTGWGGFYTLRYLSCQESFKEGGQYMESKKHAHSISIGQRSYYNRYDHSISL